MLSSRRFFVLLGMAAAFGIGCGGAEPEVINGDGDGDGLPTQGKADASAVAVFLDFEFDGTLTATSCWNPNAQIENQLLFTVGQLNGDNSVGRLDQLDITNVEKTDGADGCQITYHARMPVAWGKRNDIPTSYELVLPRDLRSAAATAFAAKYEHGCLASGAHDVTPGIFWYYFRPARSACSLADEDVYRIPASVDPSPIHTTGKYPEYHEIWKDAAFEAVAVFGKYEDDATSGDAGIDAYNRFTREIKQLLQPNGLVTTPAEIPYAPGVDMPDVTFEATLPTGGTVRVVALLVDSVGSADSTFWARYESLTPTADFIVYNGHAGLGANIKKLAKKGSWKQGQYAIVFMNGCDTYAYIDSELNEAHAHVNPDDPDGTKYLDIVANAMPSFFRSMSGATMALIRNLLDPENPRTYEQIFQQIDSAEVVLVTGEHDNVFVPGYDPGGDPTGTQWAGMDESGTVAKDEQVAYQTPVLEAGRYTFALDGNGDADLYVRVGLAPTLELYDCRPYIEGSAETCEVVIETPAPVHVLVVGWEDSSDYQLTAERTASE